MNAIHSEIFDSWKVNKALENLIKNEDIKEIPSGKTRKYVMNKKADQGSWSEHTQSVKQGFV